jgi:hypothetical protein
MRLFQAMRHPCNVAPCKHFRQYFRACTARSGWPPKQCHADVTVACVPENVPTSTGSAWCSSTWWHPHDEASGAKEAGCPATGRDQTTTFRCSWKAHSATGKKTKHHPNLTAWPAKIRRSSSCMRWCLLLDHPALSKSIYRLCQHSMGPQHDAASTATTHCPTIRKHHHSPVQAQSARRPPLSINHRIASNAARGPVHTRPVHCPSKLHAYSSAVHPTAQTICLQPSHAGSTPLITTPLFFLVLRVLNNHCHTRHTALPTYTPKHCSRCCMDTTWASGTPSCL